MRISKSMLFKTRSIWVKVSTITLTILLATGFFIGLLANKNGHNPSSESIPPIPVRVTQVHHGFFDVQLSALGTVTAAQMVMIKSRVGGPLMRVDFKEGEEVKAGQLLASIDPRPFEVSVMESMGTVEQIRSQILNAQADLKRYTNANLSTSQQILENKQASVTQLLGALKNAEAKLMEAKLNLTYSEIRSPIDGRVGLRQIDVGNLMVANAEKPLTIITQLNPIDVVFSIPEKDLPALQEARALSQQLVVEAWTQDGLKRIASGEMISLDNQIDRATASIKIKAAFENTDERLYPNQFVQVRLYLKRLDQALLMPSDALHQGPNGTYVYRVDTQNVVHMVPIKVQYEQSQLVVIHEGLSVGDTVIMEGSERLKDGAKVEVVKNDALKEEKDNSSQALSHP